MGLALSRVANLLGAPREGSPPSVLAGKAIETEVARRVLTGVLRRCDRSEERLEEILYETVYQEEQRLGRYDPDPRTPGDTAFLTWLRREFSRADDERLRELLYAVVRRYTEEISGVFDPRVYRFATRALPPALGALMHGWRPSPALFEVRDRILIEGELEAVQAAARLGTLVLVPTHVSNLDSLAVAYAIYALGLPPFAYGAGLNLFTNALTGFFMRNLGAFTVDRRKSDPLYRATLKEYATLLLERGQHTLFFPGGTRSRAGAIETRLKLGFLGTAITAYGNRQRAGLELPIFIVPCTLSYPLVLEAESLAAEYLRSEGGPHYLERLDEFERPARWFDFLRRVSELNVQMHIRFGRPLDILGNEVDELGVSHDLRGHALEPARYLWVAGRVAEDHARDAEYTRLLAGHILCAYRRDAVALPSSALAFALFEQLRSLHPQLDIFRLLRVLGARVTVQLDVLLPVLKATVEQLRALGSRNEIVLSEALATGSTEDVLERGIETLASYHHPPVLRRHDSLLQVGEPSLLFYYRNRLDGYGLLDSPQLSELVARRPRRAP